MISSVHSVTTVCLKPLSQHDTGSGHQRPFALLYHGLGTTTLLREIRMHLVLPTFSKAGNLLRSWIGSLIYVAALKQLRDLQQSRVYQSVGTSQWRATTVWSLQGSRCIALSTTYNMRVFHLYSKAASGHMLKSIAYLFMTKWKRSTSIDYSIGSKPQKWRVALVQSGYSSERFLSLKQRQRSRYSFAGIGPKRTARALGVQDDPTKPEGLRMLAARIWGDNRESVDQSGLGSGQ